MTRTLTLAAALLILLTACGGDSNEEVASPPPTTVAVPSFPGEATATPTPTPQQPTPSATPTTLPTVAGGEQVIVDVYFLRENASGLWLEPVPVGVNGPGVAAAALDVLIAGQPPSGLSRVLPDGTSVAGVDLDPDGLLTVDLSMGAGGLGAAYEASAVQALVLTATQFDTVDRVQILLDGQASETLSGHVEIAEPLEPDPFAISPILITTATGIGGSGVGGGSIELAGTANVFEAVFELDLLDAGGNVIEPTFPMATCGSGCRGEWTASFTDLEPGAYTVVAREEDASDGEGRPVFEVSITVEVP